MLLTIADNGTGMDLADKSLEGMGLPNMRDRAKMLGGELDFVTEPGKGFTLFLKLKMTGNE